MCVLLLQGMIIYTNLQIFMVEEIFPCQQEIFSKSYD